MALPNVSVQIQNGGLGKTAVPDDRVVGIVLNCIGYNKLPLGVAYQFFSVDDFNALATANSAVGLFVDEARRQISDFYAEAGTGAELWVTFSDPDLTADQLFTGGMVANLLNMADGRINVVAISRFLENEPANPVVLDGLNADILNAMDETHALAVDYATQNRPVRIILDGKNFTGDTTLLRNLKSHSFNRVAINVASNRANAVNACQGLLLGRIARNAVNTNIGRVKDGSVATSSGYLTSKLSVKLFGLKATALHNKGFIFLRQFPGKGGFYFNDDHTATADTDDFSSLANGRVIDKAHRITYVTFLDELLDNVQVDPTTGKIAATTVKQYQAKIERAIGLAMVANGEISGVQAFIDPAQDILATSTLKVDLRITPTGTNRDIVVKLGLTNPNAA